jgi:hypothetical protein
MAYGGYDTYVADDQGDKVIESKASVQDHDRGSFTSSWNRVGDCGVENQRKPEFARGFGGWNLA